MQALFDNCNQHISANRDPDLRLDRVLAGTQQWLDAQVLLEPLEKQFDLPALAVQLADELGLQGEVVGQKCDTPAGLVLDHDTGQGCRVVLARIKHRQHTGLIAQHGAPIQQRVQLDGDNPGMAQGKRISAQIGGDALQAIKDMGAAARLARSSAGDGQAVAAARLGVHVQTIARIESGEPGVAIGHVLCLLALY